MLLFLVLEPVRPNISAVLSCTYSIHSYTNFKFPFTLFKSTSPRVIFTITPTKPLFTVLEPYMRLIPSSFLYSLQSHEHGILKNNFSIKSASLCKIGREWFYNIV